MCLHYRSLVAPAEHQIVDERRGAVLPVSSGLVGAVGVTEAGSEVKVVDVGVHPADPGLAAAAQQAVAVNLGGEAAGQIISPLASLTALLLLCPAKRRFLE